MMLNGCYTDADLTVQMMFITLSKLGFISGVAVHGNLIDFREGFFTGSTHNIQNYINRYFPQ